MRKNFVVPIIDAGFSESFQQAVLGYSGSNQRAELMRSVDLNLGLKQDEWVNRMEVLYADSKFSAPIQLADLICGLRSIVDTEKVKPEHKFSEYKKQMLSIGHSLESAMIIDSIASLRFDGEIQGPQEFST